MLLALAAFCVNPAVRAQEPSAPPTPTVTPGPASGTPTSEASASNSANATSPAPTKFSDHQRLAMQQGQAEAAVLDWVLANSGPFKGETYAGPYRVAFSITPAEGWWDKAGDGKLVWHAAPAGNFHLRIFVADSADGRLMPGLTVRATMTDTNGNRQSVPTDFGWYPLLNAYGGNVPLVTDGSYTLRVTLDPLTVRDPVEAERFASATVAEFAPVPIVLKDIAPLPLGTSVAFNHEAAMLRPVNAAFSAAIRALWEQSASGMEQPVADYFIGYAINTRVSRPAGAAEIPLHGRLGLSGKENVHLALIVRDARTGRLIPELAPTASLISADGKLYGPGEMPLQWDSWVNHYGRDARVPRKGTYRLRVHFEAPGFRRWGSQGEHFALPADADFENVKLE